MWGLNWGKGTRAGTEAGVMNKTGIMQFTPPFGVTTAIMEKGRGISMMCLVPNKASAVHLGHQIMRPLYVPRKQFGRLLR